MLKSELIDALNERSPDLPREAVQRAVNIIRKEIFDAVANGGRAEIRGFGSFFLSRRPRRRARNPRTGEHVMVEAKWFPRFKAGQELREKVDRSRGGGDG